MKHFSFFFFLFASALMLRAQDGTHVLEHIAPEEATATPNYWGQNSPQGLPLWGYYIGHNAFGDEEFGEKYEIDGHGDVVGIIAYIGGTANSSGSIELNLYEAASSGLPGNLVRSKAVSVSNITADGTTPTMVMFDEDGHVDDAFFVTMNLTDYSHDPHSDTLVLMMGPDGSRPTSDDVFGRNVIRWHSHSSMNWKDFATQNFTPLQTYFAIYPIMEGDGPLSTDASFVAGAAPTYFPVPFQDELNIRFDAMEQREMFIRIFSIDGKLLHTERRMAVNGENVIRLNTNQYPAGSYVVAVEAGAYRYARVVSK